MHLGDVGGVWVPESLAGLAGDGVGFGFVAFANRGNGLGGDAVAGFGFPLAGSGISIRRGREHSYGNIPS